MIGRWIEEICNKLGRGGNDDSLLTHTVVFVCPVDAVFHPVAPPLPRDALTHPGTTPFGVIITHQKGLRVVARSHVLERENINKNHN